MAITKVITVPSELPHARLYLDDLDEICRILLDAIGNERKARDTGRPEEGFTTSFLMNGLRLDSIEDLKEYGGSATTLSVEVGGEYAECRLSFYFFGNPTVTLYHLGSERAFATYAKVKSILDWRGLKVRNITAQMPEWVSLFLPTILLFGAFSLIQISQGHRAIVAVLSFGTLALLLYFGARPSRVYFVYSHERSKGRRKKTWDYIEKIALLIAGALIGLTISKLFPR